MSISLNRINGINIGSIKKFGLPSTLRNKFLDIWTNRYVDNTIVGDLNGNIITITNKDFSTNYIPDTTSATFAVPDNASFIAADGTDDFWFNSSNVRLQKSFTDLIESTTLRTFIKYNDFEPYIVSIIGILKTGETITDSEKILLNRYFKLWVQYWGEIMMESGYMKDNRNFIDI